MLSTDGVKICKEISSHHTSDIKDLVHVRLLAYKHTNSFIDKHIDKREERREKRKGRRHEAGGRRQEAWPFQTQEVDSEFHFDT